MTAARSQLPSIRIRLGFLLAWPTLAILGLVATPFFLLLRISVAPRDINGLFGSGLSFEAFGALLEPGTLSALLSSMNLAFIVSITSLVFGLPLTYWITRMGKLAQTLWLVFLLTTLTLSDVLTAFSWQVILSKRVGLSQLFVTLGLRDEPVSLTPSSNAVIACLVYLVLPFTVLTLYPALSRLNRSLVEAARTLGATPWRAFATVVLPLTKPAATTAFFLAAVLTIGSYVPPLVLGRPQDWPMAVLIGNTALNGHDLPRASAMSLFLLVVTACLAFVTFQAMRRRVKK